ncbi:MAG: hypothetical protein U9R27_11640 [Campylobacterota bacterium]|nr:hypothetical protein [Campylobacterota bacterium]
MNPKKFTYIFLSLFIVSYTLLYLLYYLVNPEQVFLHSITKKKFFYTKEYSRRQFKALKENRYTLLFGTSQIHKISSKMLGEDLLNFHNIYGEPGDILNFLHQLDTKQINHIEQILYCIDLSAKADREEGELIEYDKWKIDYPILTIEKLTRTIEDIVNNHSTLAGYLNEDGSMEHIDKKQHSRFPHHPYEIIYSYDDKLINGILEIDRWAKDHHKKITFFTPVTSDAFFKTINFKKLSPFFSSLLDGGIQNIKLFYHIPGMTDARDDKSEYSSFMDPTHLNVYFVDRWLHQYILTEDRYSISDANELNIYIREAERLQAELKF